MIAADKFLKMVEGHTADDPVPIDTVLKEMGLAFASIAVIMKSYQRAGIPVLMSHQGFYIARNWFEVSQHVSGLERALRHDLELINQLRRKFGQVELIVQNKH
jgi:hypothetical protein